MNPVKYAEDYLGVHTVYEEAEKLVKEIDDLSAELDVWHDNKRSQNEDILDREAELIAEERGKHPEFSATALDTHLRRIKRTDSQLIHLRSVLNNTLGQIQGGEYDLAVLKFQLDIKKSRMYELGGYFNFLASVKYYAAQKYPSPATSSITPWEQLESS